MATSGVSLRKVGFLLLGAQKIRDSRIALVAVSGLSSVGFGTPARPLCEQDLWPKAGHGISDTMPRAVASALAPLPGSWLGPLRDELALLGVGLGDIAPVGF